MGFRFENPQWLLVAALAIPAAWIALRWFVTMTSMRRWSAAVARALLLAAIASLLAGAMSVHRTNRLAVVALIDVSDSVRRFAAGPEHADGTRAEALNAVRGFLEEATAGRGAEDLLGVVVFDGRAVAVATPSRADVLGRPIEVSGVEGTNIEAALRYASALIPADAAGRLVLFSDGNETAGSAGSAAAELTARLASRRGGRSGLPVDVVPLRYEVREEVIVESVDVPPSAPAESVVPVRVVLLSAGEAQGTLRVLRGGEELDINGGSPGRGRALRLGPGRTVEVIEAPLEPGRVHRFDAVWEPRVLQGEEGGARLMGDVRAENNAASGLTITPGRGEVLIVDGVGSASEVGAGATLARTLEGAGMRVTMVSPEAMPDDLVSLQAYDLVVLQDAAADLVSERAQRALAAHVEQIGAGLVMVGGFNSFAPGGWKGSSLAPLLPVDMEIPDELVVPTAAVVIVLDSSGSMGHGVMGSLRTQQEIANESAALAVATLDKRDLVGVIAFDTVTREVVPLAPNTDPQRTGGLIRSISPSGGTQMGPALERAQSLLLGAEAELRHVVVLSDGQSTGAEGLPVLAEQMGEAGIRVTTISVGSGADVATMQAIADMSGGKHYVVLNPGVLPRIFIKAIRVVRTPLVRESPFVPRVLPTGSPLVEGLDDPPVLGGLVLTRARTEPTIVNAMVTPKGEPVLAHWQVGLGQVAAFTSDARADQWAQRWADWPGYRLFWTRLARTLSRPTSAGPYELRMLPRDDGLVLRLEAVDERGAPIDYLRVPASVYDEEGRSREVQLSQVAPGVYEARVRQLESGQIVAVVRPRLGARQLPPVVGGMTIARGEEYRTLRSNEPLLRDLAEATGGRVLDLADPRGADLFDRAGVPPRITSVPVFLPLMLLTLGLFVLDVATRRIAWDRFVSKEFGADLRRAAAEATRSRGEQAGRAIAGLKAGRPRPEEPAASARTFGEESAADLVAQARERRAREEAERLRRLREEMMSVGAAGSRKPAPVEEEPREPAPAGEEEGAGGLLAAKRRARERFERERGESQE